MANSDVRFGLRALRLRDGSPISEPANHYFVPSTYATALFVGDPIVKTGTANTAAAGTAGTFPAGTLPEINKATAADANAITGVIVGFEVDGNNDNRIHNPASTERVVLVNDCPDVVWEIQSDSANATAATDIGANANLVYTHAGSTVTGLSGAELDTSSMTTTATFQLKILRLKNVNNNEIGTNSKLEVLINNHTEASNIAGI